jgi:hypothetical protein
MASNIDPLALVWPVTVKQYLMWHGVDEPAADALLQQNGLEGMTLRRAIAGSKGEERCTSVRAAELGEVASGHLLEMVRGSDSQWEPINAFLRKQGRGVICPLAASRM